MNCPKCKNENPDDAKLCVKCGFQLKKVAESITTKQMTNIASTASSRSPKMTQEYLPLFYSKAAIYVYSLFFTVIAGGILLSLNFKKVNNKKGIAITLGISFVIFLAQALELFYKNDLFAISPILVAAKKTFLVDNHVGVKYASNSIGTIYNLVGAVILCHPLWNHYLDNIKYKKKSYGLSSGIIIVVICFIVASLSMFLYDRTQTEEDLAAYKVEMSEILPLEKKAIDNFKSLQAGNLDNHTASARLNNEVIPQYTELKTKVLAIVPKTPELQEIHGQLIQWVSLQLDSFLKMQNALANNDDKLESEAVTQADEVRKLQAKWASSMESFLQVTK